MKRTKTLSIVSDEVIAEVERAEQIKLAEVAAVRAATPRFTTEIGSLMAKVAETLRNEPVEVTYSDLEQYLAGGAR